MNHSEQLKTELLDLEYPVNITVYADGEVLTANNPANFISITNNGAARTRSSEYSIIEQTLSVAIYVKLLSTGAKNTKLENAIFERIFDKFKFTQASGDYTFAVAKNNMFGNYKNLTAGYSTRIINIESNYIKTKN